MNFISFNVRLGTGQKGHMYELHRIWLGSRSGHGGIETCIPCVLLWDTYSNSNGSNLIKIGPVEIETILTNLILIKIRPVEIETCILCILLWDTYSNPNEPSSN